MATINTMHMSDIKTADPAKYDAPIINTPPSIGTQDPCLLP